MKTYKFTTRDFRGQEIIDYTIEDYNIQGARKYAKNILGNSRHGEVSNSKIKLA